MNSDEFLEHYGVRGMKWGVRKKRSSRVKKGKNSATNPIKDLSDDELRTRIARLDLEKRYSDLSKGPNQQKSSKGKKLVDDVLTQSGKNLGTTLVTGAGALAIASVLSKKGLKPEHVKALTKLG